ncbi:MAG: hypothetical protein RSB82_01060 [Victivallaceae bacterium]
MKKTFKLLLGYLSLIAVVSSCVAPGEKIILQPSTVAKDIVLGEASFGLKE